MIWTNSLGLKKAGIDIETPNPDGGEICRDEHRSPTGILAENAAILFYQNVDPPPRGKSLKQIDEVVAECHRKGVTAVGNFDDLVGFELLQDYHRRRGLRLRVRQYIPVRFLEHLLRLKLKSGLGDSHLEIAGVKLYADGALGSRTALMFEPYRGSRDNYGVEVSTEAEMTACIKAAASNGLACAVHAIGDRANHQALNAFERLPQRLRRLRHRIEHVQVARPEDLTRFAQLNVIASVQPSHCSADIEMARKHWGKRSRHAYNFRNMIDSGAVLAFGSDAPIESIDPILGLYSATTRQSFDGKKRFHPEQRVTVDEAVAGFTTGGAYALADEALYGTIAPGRSADIVIMSQDPFRTKPADLRDVEIAATFFEGECVYGSDNITS
jgi:predicted amidohydrolase YtcJ